MIEALIDGEWYRVRFAPNLWYDDTLQARLHRIWFPRSWIIVIEDKP